EEHLGSTTRRLQSASGSRVRSLSLDGEDHCAAGIERRGTLQVVRANSFMITHAGWPKQRGSRAECPGASAGIAMGVTGATLRAQGVPLRFVPPARKTGAMSRVLQFVLQLSARAGNP